MKIRTFKKLEGGVYRISIYTQDWSELDRNLMTKFDEPEIDKGGDFTGAPSVSYTLDNDLARIMSESPFTAAFDIDDYADAHDRAEVWADTIQARITSAVTTLRLNADGYTSEEVTEV
jgi:hypothetical protein